MLQRILVLVALAVLSVEATATPDLVDESSRPVPGTTVDPVEPERPLKGIDAILLTAGLGPLTQVVGSPIDDRLYVVEKAGRILVSEGTELHLFLDIQDFVLSVGNEQGLLSLLFHPRFEENGRFFIFYTDRLGDSNLVEARVVPGRPDRVEMGSFRLVLEVPQEFQYHQSGSMVFGPDGFLWVSIGDGGGQGDPQRNGQDPTNLYATIIRIDVDGPEPYGIPADNPFVGSANGEAPEVWAYGVRNPWRITIDEGLLYIPDVGQEEMEEVNAVPISKGGFNFGWSVTEGTLCYREPDCDRSGITMPIWEYPHAGDGCAIVGGGVYRGVSMPELHGHFFFADYCLGWIRSLSPEGEVVDWTEDLGGRKGNVSSYGFDRHGEMYVVNLAGEVWKFVSDRD